MYRPIENRYNIVTSILFTHSYIVFYKYTTLMLYYHHPVMIKEVLWYIDKQIVLSWNRPIHIFDGTLGHAGHLIAIMQHYSKYIGSYTAVDTDNIMLSTARERLQSLSNEWLCDLAPCSLIHDTYANIVSIADHNKRKYDIVFLDLGVNLWHFKQHERWFSIKWEWLLDMRYNTQDDSLMNAQSIINSYDREQLIRMFTLNSEISDMTSSSIADEIIRQRASSPFITTTQLNNLTKKLNYSARVAAIVFQALRIEVNKEFESLSHALVSAVECMAPSSSLLVLSYHSIEDRIVKYAFKDLEVAWKWSIITKHAIPPSYQEVQSNKPSRSARLRVFRCL